jgi:hypothetical protein
MRRFPGLAAAALALVLAADAFAQSTTKYVFVAVDAVSVRPGRVTITGILEGESAPVERYADFSISSTANGDALQACHRAALLALEKPGAYRLEIVLPYGYPPATCNLARVKP